MQLADKFSDLVSRSTGLILLLVALLFALAITEIIDFGTGKLRLEIDPSANRLLSENSPAKQFYDRARNIFGSDETLVITLTSDDIFTIDTFRRIDRITQRIEAVEHVHHVISLTNALDIRSTGDDLDIAPFIDSIEDSPELASETRQRVLANPVYAGSLVSLEGDATAIIVYFSDMSDREFIKRGSHERIVAIVNEEQGDNRAWFTGAPHFKVAIIGILIHDLITIPPLIALVLAIVLAISFRTLLGVLVPLITVAAGVTLTLGIITAMGYSLSMISVLVPPLLMILGLSYSVHVVSAYHQRRLETSDRIELVKKTLRHVLLPVLLTGVTTIAGFAALMINPITAVREFGILSAIGVVMITLLSVTFTPALLKFLDRGFLAPAARERASARAFGRFVDRIALFDLHQRTKIFALSGILFVLALAGMSKIHVSTDFMSSFSEGSEVREAFDVVNDKLGGANPLYIVLEGVQPAVFKEPVNLRSIEELQEWLVAQPEIGGTTSVADYLKLVNQAFHDNDPAFYSIPESRQLVTQLLFLSSSDELDRIVDGRFQITNIVLRSKAITSDAMKELIGRINERLAQFPEHITATVTGNPVLINETLSDIIAGQAKSVGLALVIVYAILALMFASMRIGFVALIPNIMPVAVYFGSLGFFGISLNPSTSLIAPMVLGIAIDDTIHYFARFSREVKRYADDKKATIAALKAVGRPVTYTSVGLCLGFLVLITSELSMQVEVGIMASYALAVAWLCDFILTPALCSSVRITTLWDVLSLDLGENPQESIPLLNGLRKSQARIVAIMSRIITIPAGKRIIHDGEKGSEMYVVIDGKLNASIDGKYGPVELATYTRGDVVGEAGLFYENRTANVDTLEDSRLLCLTQENLDRLGKRYPYIATKVFKNLNKVLATRLFRTTHRLT
ncbi:MAG: MMPL family transporter [Gammaproteobacteria bacterium]|nr:MAG: MMPL family transporter [Gammaproteobacteria bacterium]